MSYRDDWLRGRLRDYLARRTIPRGFEGKAEALKAEADALVACVLRKAPREQFEGWWSAVERRLAEDAKTRAWPTEGEISEAAKAINGPRAVRVSEGNELNHLTIAAKRINAGEEVGESWVYGRGAVQLERAGLVTEARMKSYRSGWYFAHKAVYGEEAARAKEAEMQERLDSFRREGGQHREPVSVQIPDKRVEAAE